MLGQTPQEWPQVAPEPFTQGTQEAPVGGVLQSPQLSAKWQLSVQAPPRMFWDVVTKLVIVRSPRLNFFAVMDILPFACVS